MRLTELEYQNLIARGNLPHVEQSLPPQPFFSEQAFQAAVVRLARQHGWLCWHAYSAKKSVPGYPDLTLAKVGRPVLFAELKVPGGHVTLQQQAWLDALTLADGKQVHVWVPDNWPLIEARLKG